jgi:4-carboxymuconolactone decarboxylase
MRKSLIVAACLASGAAGWMASQSGSPGEAFAQSAADSAGAVSSERAAKQKVGLALMQKMFPGAVSNNVKGGATGVAGNFAGEMVTYTVEHAYADIWARPAMDLKTRSLVTIGMLIGEGAIDELRVHVQGAVSNGVTVQELEEVIYQASAYAGFPRAASARDAMVDALRAVGKLPKAAPGEVGLKNLVK